MQTGAKKILVLATAVFVAAGSYLGARLASRYIAGKLQPSEAREGKKGAEILRPEATPRLADYAIISERNLFNANPRPKGEAALPIPSPNVPAATAAEPPKPEPIKLSATLVAIAVRTQDASFAIFQEGGANNVVTTGGQVSPGVTLKEIQRDFVVVTLNGQDQKIELFATKTTPAAGAAGRPLGPRGRGMPTGQPTEGTTVQAVPASSDTIRQVSENAWVIDRRELDDAVANMSTLMTQIRVVPNLNGEGQADGFKVFSIRPASIFSRIGLLNGDILKEVNGITLNGIDQAYEAFTKLSGESSIQVNLVRRGQPQSLSYEIR